MGVYLYIVGGKQTYETLHANLEPALPALPTVQLAARTYNAPTLEGQLRMRELKTFLTDRNLPLFVWVSEDATRITGRVEYDSPTNRCVGFPPPLDQCGMPDVSIFTATDAETIEELFRKYPTAKNAYVVLAQPLQIGAPPFWLMLFGTDNKFKAQDVVNRWRYVKSKAAEQGIVVVGFSGDGGTLGSEFNFKRNVRNFFTQ